MRALPAFALTVFFPWARIVSAQVTIADAGPDQYLCSINVFLEGNPGASGEEAYWSIVSGYGSIFDLNDPHSQFMAQISGVIVLQWTITDGSNTSTDQVSIWIYDGSAPPANAGVDITVELPQTSAQLQGSPYTFPTTCQWTIVSGSGVIADPTDPITMAFGLTVGSNIFMWSCDNGPCGSTADMVDIIVQEPMVIDQVAGPATMRAWFDATADRLAVVADRIVQRVVIVDASGRVVLDRSMNTCAASLDVSHLSIGAYVIRAMTGDALFADRFVVVR
jgi:hypothetical protein